MYSSKSYQEGSTNKGCVEGPWNMEQDNVLNLYNSAKYVLFWCNILLKKEEVMILTIDLEGGLLEAKEDETIISLRRISINSNILLYELFIIQQK